MYFFQNQNLDSQKQYITLLSSDGCTGLTRVDQSGTDVVSILSRAHFHFFLNQTLTILSLWICQMIHPSHSVKYPLVGDNQAQDLLLQHQE